MVLDFIEDYLKSISLYLKGQMWHFTIDMMQNLALLAEDCSVSLYLMTSFACEAVLNGLCSGVFPTTGVCKLYSEQRAIRVKRVVDKKRL